MRIHLVDGLLADLLQDVRFLCVCSLLVLHARELGIYPCSILLVDLSPFYEKELSRDEKELSRIRKELK